MIDLVGWVGAVVLLLTVGRQVYTQWKSRSIQGVSRWLFVGQITASVAFVAYSWALQNWVFVVTNAFMLATAIVGQIIYLRNKDRTPPSSGSVGAGDEQRGD
ncbi:MAG: hypothetical protein LH481_12305 [Burkholderiales bacterium]|nr:hypothetical protein [Burkholderiales bacterium]